MNFNEYTDLAVRTLKDKGLSLNILHGISGAGTEIGELVDAYKRNVFYGTVLDKVNVTEEVGDILWYIAVLAKQLDITTFTFEHGITDPQFEMALSKPAPAENVLLVLTACFNEVGQMASSFMYGLVNEEDTGTLSPDSVEHLTAEVTALLDHIKYNCLIMGVDIVEAATVNIAKLKKRYPDTFTEEAAVNRDTDAEREVLELLAN